MKHIERRIDKELERAYWNSGHAFVCFDTLESMNTVLEHYKPSPYNFCMLSLRSLKHKFNSLFQQPRERNVSTFDKFHDIDQQEL